MASQKLKAASQRKFQRPSTPYIRPKPKSFVQTVKDWLTPSKWISQGVEENSVDASNDHAPSVIHWPGTPHPIRGHHLDQHGRTHSIKEPVPQLQYSLEEEQDHEIVITKGESVPFLAGEEEVSTDEEDMDANETATAHSSVPITESNPTYVSRNGLIPATESGPLLHYSQKVTLRPVKKPQVSSNSPKLNLSSSPQKLLTSTPQISPLERLHSSSLPSSASPVTNIDITPSVVPSTRPSFSVAAFKTPTQTLTNLSLSRSPFNSPFYTGRTAFGGASSGQKAASFRKRTRTDTNSSNTVPVRHVIKSHPPDSTHFSKDAASETARRILDTLQSLSTPLQDARKLPLRVASPAKRQRIEGSRHHHSSPLSPPPPVASLTAPIRAPLSHVKQPFVKVPSEIQPPKGTRTVSVDLTSPTPMSPPATKPAKSHSPFSSQSGKIRSAKHTSHYSSKNKKEDAPSNPLELPSPIPLPLSTSGALPVFSFGNLLSPNSVLKTGGANSTFSMPAIMVSTTSSIVATPLSTSQSDMYSFKSPTVFTTKSYPQTTPTSSTTDQFQFSKPVIVDKTTPSTTTQMSTLSKPSFTPTSTLTSTFPTSSSMTYSPPAPPLKSLSVLDALKRPEYQIENIRKEAQKQTVMTGVSKVDTSATSVAKQLSLTKTIATSVPTCTTLTSASPDIITTSVSNWNCDECWVVNIESQTICVACGTKRPAVDEVSNPTKLTNSNTSKVTISVGEEISLKTQSSVLPPPSNTLPFVGFKLPLTGDLNLSKEKPQTTALTKATPSAPPSTSSNSKSIPLSVFAPPTSNWECPSCLVSNQPEQQICIACGSKACKDTSITNIEKSESTSKAKPPLAAFAPPTSNWECPTCMISNKPDVKTCGACGTNKPGGNYGDDTKATQTFKLGESGGLKLSSSLFGKPVSEASSSDQPKLSSQSSGGFKINVSLSGVTKSQSVIGNSVTTQVTSLKSSEPTSVPSLVPNLTTSQPIPTKTTSTTLNIPKPNLTSNTFSGLKFEAPPIVSTSSQPPKPTPALPTIPSLNFPKTAPPTSQPPVSASLFSSFISPTITPTSTSNQSSESGNVSTLFPNIGGAGLFGNNKTMASSTGGNNQQLLFGQKESAPFPTLSTSTLQSTTAQTSNIFGGGGSLMATSQTGNTGFAVTSFLTATQTSGTTMLASSQASNISLPVPPQTGLLGGSDCSITQTPSLTGGSSGLSVFSGGPKSTQSSLVFPPFGTQTQLIPTQATGGIFNPSAVSSQGGGKSGDGGISGGIFGGTTKSNPITMGGAVTSTGFNFTQMTPSINFTSLPNQGLVFGQASSSVSSTPFQFPGSQSGNQPGISNPSQGGFVFGQPSTNNSFQFTGTQTGNQSGQSSASIPSQGPIFGQPFSSAPGNAQFSYGGQTGMSIPTVDASSQQNPFAIPASMNTFGRGGKQGRTLKKAVRKRGK